MMKPNIQVLINLVRLKVYPVRQESVRGGCLTEILSTVNMRSEFCELDV